MNSKNILIFPCGTEIANEVINSLVNHKYFNTIFASSEGTSYCNFRKKDINILPFVDDKDFIFALNKLIENQNIHFIIPAHDDVAFELSRLEKKINCKIIGQSYAVNKIVRFKDNTYTHFKDILPIANTYDDIPHSDDFPVFVKPIKGQGALNATSLKDLKTFKNFFNQHQLKEFIIMEELTGDEFTIDCFSDSGDLLYSGARSRDKMTRGIAVLSSFISNKSFNTEIASYAQTISENMNLHGVWFFQMKYDKKGHLKLLEIGPRVPGSMMLNRARGVNFIELSLFQAMDYKVEVSYNDIEISLARALVPKYKHNISFCNLYIDFDDTLFLNEEKINSHLLKLIFDIKNEKKSVYLITKNEKNNLTKTLHNFGITSIFDDIIHLRKEDEKIDYMQEKSLLIDDSFLERKKAIQAGHYAYGIDNLNILD